MADTLVDKIMHNILSNQTNKMQINKNKNILNRPNYQRYKSYLKKNDIDFFVNDKSFLSTSEGKDCLNIIKNKSIPIQGILNSITKQVSASSLINSDISEHSLKYTNNVDNIATNHSNEIELSSINNKFFMGKNITNLDTLKSHEISSKSKIFGQAHFVGTAIGNTLGYVIPNIDFELQKLLKTNINYRAVGVISSRQGAASHIMATDEAIKKTNSSVIKIQLAKDDFDGTGNGVFILLGADDIADVTQAVKIILNYINKFQENIVQTKFGKIETHFSARSAEAVNIIFGIPLNQAFGIIIGAPAGVGLLLSDAALKSAPVTAVMLNGPSTELAFANEIWFTITGDSASVKSALETAKDVGLKVLSEFVCKKE